MTGGSDDQEPALGHVAQRRLAARLFNSVWQLLETENRTTDEDDLMVHAAHASAYHWRQVGNAENFARSTDSARACTLCSDGASQRFATRDDAWRYASRTA